MDHDMDDHESEFRHDLAALLNRNSMENASNTPDFILANYLIGCLEAFDQAVQQRETWYGRVATPGAPFASALLLTPEPSQ